MNVSEPILDIIPGPRGLVLSALANLVRRRTGREIATYAGVPQSTAARILADLVDAGIAEAEPVGSAIAYSLNRDHLTARAVTELAGARSELINEMRNSVGAWEVKPVAAWLFGSTARADGDRHADVDLFFVTPDSFDIDRWEDQLGVLADRVMRLAGNRVQIVEHTVGSFRELDAARSGLTASLRSDGIELVAGSWLSIATASR